MNKHLPNWARTWQAWMAFCLVLGSAYALLAETVPGWPRWAWFSEHQTLVELHEDDIDAVELTHETDTVVLAGEIKRNTIRILEEAVSFYQREGRALRAEARSLKRKGDHDPRLQQDIEENEDKLRAAASKLKAKRGH